ncbi:hypothetical protein ACLESO_03555 [Pyxidicoccus sp. 3LG]
MLHFLPPYCPEGNRIERLWLDLHANVTRNHRCRTLAQSIPAPSRPQAYRLRSCENRDCPSSRAGSPGACRKACAVAGLGHPVSTGSNPVSPTTSSVGIIGLRAGELHRLQHVSILGLLLPPSSILMAAGLAAGLRCM